MTGPLYELAKSDLKPKRSRCISMAQALSICSTWSCWTQINPWMHRDKRWHISSNWICLESTLPAVKIAAEAQSRLPCKGKLKTSSHWSTSKGLCQSKCVSLRISWHLTRTRSLWSNIWVQVILGFKHLSLKSANLESIGLNRKTMSSHSMNKPILSWLQLTD